MASRGYQNLNFDLEGEALREHSCFSTPIGAAWGGSPEGGPNDKIIQ